jgi:formylglycine-generating enzyme required for sulfatase activity
MLYNYLLNNDDTYLATSDVNGDGNVTSADVTAVYSILLGDSQQIPEYIDFTVNGVTFRMIYVKGGTFTMGNNDIASESPAHSVTLTDFYMAETECTQALWNAILPEDDYFAIKGAEKPCNGQRYSEMIHFIEALNQYAHEHELIPAGAEFVLPTEAQWEWAARGGVKSQGYRYAGSDNCAEVAWTMENSEETLHDVKQLQPNELGLYDMSGNAYEAASDNFASNYSWAADGAVDPTGKDSSDISPDDMGYGCLMRRSSGYMAPAWRATVSKRSMYDFTPEAGYGASTDMSFRLAIKL